MTTQRFCMWLDRLLYVFVVSLFAFLPISRAGMNVFAGLTAIVFVTKLMLLRDVSSIRESDPLPALAVLGAVLSSMFGSASLEASVGKFLTGWLKYIVVYFAVVDVISTEKRQQQLIWILFVGGLVSSIYAVFQHWIAPYNRVTSFMNNPNPAGTYLAMSSLLSLSLLVVARGTYSRLLFLSGALLGAAGVLFTMSRGALLGLGAALLVFAGVVGKLWHTKKAITIVIIALTVVGLFMPDTIVSRFESAVDLHDSSNRQRVYLFLAAWRMFRDSVLNGNGIGTFGVLYPVYKPDGALDFDHPHNVYLYVLAEMGLLGAAALGWFSYRVIRKTIHNLWSGHRDLYWANSLGVLLIGILLAVHGLVDVTIRFSEVGLPVLALVALLMKNSEIKSQVNDNY